MSLEQKLWSITAKVKDKEVCITCGDGSQRVRWLGHVAIARWDENNQGWKRLGIPVKIVAANGKELDMGEVIRDVLCNGDVVTVHCSLDPFETR